MSDFNIKLSTYLHMAYLEKEPSEEEVRNYLQELLNHQELPVNEFEIEKIEKER